MTVVISYSRHSVVLIVLVDIEASSVEHLTPAVAAAAVAAGCALGDAGVGGGGGGGGRGGKGNALV